MKRRDLLDRVRETVKSHGMLGRGECVLAAVSGGADSVTMLNLLYALREEFSIRLVVFHLNHNLRGREAERDLNFVRRLSARLGLEFEGRRLKAGELGKGSTQEAAREARYRHMLEAAGKYGAKRIALGHTLDDQAETVLIQLLKGAGGLAGIPPVRGPFIRPLIAVKREEIEEFAAGQGIRFVVDSTNRVSKYLRNDIRLNLIPYLKTHYNPNITGALSLLASLMRDDRVFLDSEAKALLPGVIIEKGRETVVLDRKKLVTLHRAMKSRLVIMAIRFLDEKYDTCSSHIMSCLNVVEGGRPNASVTLPNGIVLKREYDRLIFTVVPAEEPVAFSMPLNVPGATVLKEAGYEFKATFLRKPPSSVECGDTVAYFDRDAFMAASPYTLRPMESGDRMVPLNMKGSRKLKDIFIDRKLPLSIRRGVPLLCTNGEVIWAAGVKRSDRFKVGPETKRVLKIEFKLLAASREESSSKGVSSIRSLDPA